MTPDIQTMDKGTPPRIEVRAVTFAFERGSGGLWNPRRPELSHMLNAFQLALPFLEPYFIDAVKEAAARVDEPRLKAEAAAFCAQEANHSRQHQRYCRVLRARYPRLADYEKAIQQSLVRSRQEDPLEWRLAYAAGYEAITTQLARWMFRNESEFFDQADPHFAALMMWHAAEEIEHRHVAFDALQAVNRSYALRARGMFAALRKTMADVIPVVKYMLAVDGYGASPASHIRRFALRARLGGQLMPAVGRYLAPGHHPSKMGEPRGAAEWRQDYERGGGREWGAS
jgi:predicted metal-dependent hydrolase